MFSPQTNYTRYCMALEIQNMNDTRNKQEEKYPP